jgi:hypothetical protein
VRAATSPAVRVTKKSGLDLTSYEGLMKGTKFGAMVIPRDSERSNLMARTLRTNSATCAPGAPILATTLSANTLTA